MSFTQLGLNSDILKAIKEQGYTEPTPIQKQAIPVILQKEDVLAAAQTGTGKTAGFTLPMLNLLSAKSPKKGKKPYVRALILTPTRELASQVAQNVEEYSQYLPIKTSVIFGGVGINPQKAQLRKGVDIVIATPGRLLDHVSQNSIDLSRVEFLVLDEADRMLDMGFIHDIKKVISNLPSHRQNLLFSATFSDEIKKLASGFLNNPKIIEVARRNTSSAQVEQIVHYVQKDNKRNLLCHIIKENNLSQVLVFTRTKHGANRLTDYLKNYNISASAIHGSKSQGARTKALADFKSNEIRVLVATDIAARGIDIELLPNVINYELPNVPEDYVHRIGRTGRAGNVGIAMSLVCNEEYEYLRDIEKLIKKDLEVVAIDGYTVSKLTKVKKDTSNKNNNSRNSNRNSKPKENKREKRSDRKDDKNPRNKSVKDNKKRFDKKSENKSLIETWEKELKKEKAKPRNRRISSESQRRVSSRNS